MSDDSKKWETYEEISTAMAKEHSIEELSAWLSDLSSELAQWSLRCACHGTPYKKSDLMVYIQYMAKVTQLLMAVHCKIKEENPELYDVIEHSVMSDFCNTYCSD